MTTKRALEPKEAADYLAAHPSARLIDVRQPEEYQRAHLKGAKLVPLMTFPTFMQECPKGQDLVLYCAAGSRSGQALAWCLQEGYTEAKHIQGGIGAWMASGLPTEK